jgi:hypothetical protein
MLGDSQGTVNVLGVDSIGGCEKRNSYEHQSNIYIYMYIEYI